MEKIDPRNPPNEFPDIVGPHPTNPILASFRPFIPDKARLREFTPLPIIIGTLLGMVFGRVLALSRAQGRHHSQCFDSCRGACDHDISRSVQIRAARFDHSRKQHRADCRLSRRIDRVRSRRDHAGDHDSRVRSRDHACDAGRDSGRLVRHPHDDPDAPRAHRSSTWLPEISGGNGLR